jgi:hypothetical protein
VVLVLVLVSACALVPASVTTVRERVKAIQIEVRDSVVGPDRARALLTSLTGLLGHCQEEIRIADAEYGAVLLMHLESGERVHLSKLRAERTPEYQHQREAKDTKELVQELMRSLKYLLRSAETERFTR